MSELVLSLIRILINDGIPELIKVIDRWKLSNPGLDDFQKLKDAIKRPEDF